MKKLQLLLVFLIIEISKIFSQTILPDTLNCNTTLTIAGSPYLAMTNINVPKECILTVQAGVEIQMAGSTSIIIKGKVEFLGSRQQPIYLHAKDSAWGHVFLDNTSQKSVFNYLTIENATNGPDGNSHFTTVRVAAITGYYSSLSLDHVTFKNNLKSVYSKHGDISVSNCIFDSSNVGEKILVQFSKALVENSTFYYTYGTGDAIDFDAVKDGIIKNNNIYGGEADGIDIGISLDSIACKNLLITDNFIQNMGDKGISVGEGSKDIHIERNVITGCDVGIGVKDKSNVIADHNTLYQNRIGIKCYDHFVGLGGGIAEVTNTIIAGSTDSTYYKESTAILSISYSLADIDSLPGIQNLKADPLFVSVQNNDFHLSSSSPCIDKGDPNSPIDTDNSRTDIGAFAFDKNTISTIETTAIVNTKHIKIFPNPVNDVINIIVSAETSTSISIHLITIEGQIVSISEQQQFIGEYHQSIKLKELAKGTYFLEIITDTECIKEKIVLN